MIPSVFILIALSLPLSAVAGEDVSPPRLPAIRDTEPVPGQPYDRYFTNDRLDRRITFYLSEEPDTAPPLPLVIYIQGSGAQSHFRNVDGKIRGATGHSTIADVCRGRARLVLVEKPGVNDLDHHADGGGATEASPEFRREHTLERWAEAVNAAVEAARQFAEIRPGAILLIGHSEGGITAAAVAAINDQVTHVAILSGGGPTQLYDLLDGARRGTFFRGVSEDPDARVRYVLDEWKRIAADPDNADSLFFGHPWRRWSSFLKTSTLEELLKCRARVYAASGAADDAVAPESFEFLRAGLLARDRDAVFDLVPGADHSFAFPDRHEDGWAAVMERVLQWFLPDAGR